MEGKERLKTLAISLLSIALLPVFGIAQSMVPCGQDVAEKTQSDPDALRALEAPGKVFLTEPYLTRPV